MSMFPRVYQSFQEFERAELRKLDHLYASVDDMVDDMLLEEFTDEPQRRDDGILFDDPEDLDEDY